MPTLVYKPCFIPIVVFVIVNILGWHAEATPRPSQFSNSASPHAIESQSTRMVAAYRSRLVTVAMKYAQLEYVPYVYGGANIADESTCLSCQMCIEKKHLVPNSRKRLLSCPACRQCGIDCSHFVNIVYSEAGLDFPYANTSSLKRLTAARNMPPGSQLVDIGTNATQAEPGDLLLYRNHIVMLLSKAEGGFGDIIHATRVDTDRRIGGIFFEANIFLPRFRGKLIRILRHRDLIREPVPDVFSGLSGINWGEIAWESRR